MDAVPPLKNTTVSVLQTNWAMHFCASWRRVAAGIFGPILLGLGSGISVSAGFGAVGFSVFLDGIHHSFGQSLWLTQLIITFSCYLLAWLWAGIPLGIGTIPALLFIGPAISLGASATPEYSPFIYNLLAFIIGMGLFALGICLAAAAKLGPDGITALSLAAEKKHQWPLSCATFLWNSIAIAIGIALGGNFGVATVVALFGVPVLIQWMLPPLREYIV